MSIEVQKKLTISSSIKQSPEKDSISLFDKSPPKGTDIQSYAAILLHRRRKTEFEEEARLEEENAIK